MAVAITSDPDEAPDGHRYYRNTWLSNHSMNREDTLTQALGKPVSLEQADRNFNMEPAGSTVVLSSTSLKMSSLILYLTHLSV